jgi:hypothetical protein
MPAGGVGMLSGDGYTPPFVITFEFDLDKRLREGDIRKATKAELAKEKERNTKWASNRQNLISKFGRTGGALVGDYVMITPFASRQEGILKPGEIGKLVDANASCRVGQKASLIVVPLVPYSLVGLNSRGDDNRYFDGDIRRATFEDAIAVFEAVRQKAYSENNLKVFLICSLVKDVDGTYALLEGKHPASLAFHMSDQHSVPVGVRRKIEKTLDLAAKERALQTIRRSPFGKKRLLNRGDNIGAPKPKVNDAAVVVEQPTTDSAANSGGGGDLRNGDNKQKETRRKNVQFHVFELPD